MDGKLVVVVHTCNSSTCKQRQGDWESEASLGYKKKLETFKMRCVLVLV